jgi:hypothetical protein
VYGSGSPVQFKMNINPNDERSPLQSANFGNSPSELGNTTEGKMKKKTNTSSLYQETTSKKLLTIDVPEDSYNLPIQQP